MKTLADFKKKAVVGARIRGGYFFRTPQEEIKNLEWRTIEKVQTNGIKIDGSFLDFPKASNSEFDGRILKIYAVGYRKLTDEEKAVLDEWKKITETEDYQKQLEYDLMTDSSVCWSKGTLFFHEKGMEYLYNHQNRNKYLDQNKYNDGDEYCVYDTSSQHGKQIAEYEIE